MTETPDVKFKVQKGLHGLEQWPESKEETCNMVNTKFYTWIPK